MPVPTRAAVANDVYSGNVPRKMNATEVKARLLTLLDEVGAGAEIEIVKQLRSVARLVPAVGPYGLKATFAGVAVSVAEEEELFTTRVTRGCD